MLSIHPVINQNYRMQPSFGERSEEKQIAEEYSGLQQEFKEYADERQRWQERRSEMQEIIDNEETPVVKPMKKALQIGIVGSAVALGALGTGYSAKYIIERGQEIAASKQMKNFGKFLKKHISEPVTKGFESVKTFAGKQINKVKTSKTYTEGKTKLHNKNEAFKKTSFAQFFSNTAKKISNNKVVQKVTGFVDGIFNGIAEGFVKIYNKFTGVNYKNTVANTLGAAGGISTGAATMMDMKAEEAKKKAEEAKKKAEEAKKKAEEDNIVDVEEAAFEEE